MEALIHAFFNVEILAKSAPILWAGVKMTLVLSLVVVPLGAAGGLAVALLHQTRLRWPMMLYVDFFRAFPPLVLLMFVAAAR